jgi:putative DNA primase/helicase
VKLIPVIRKNAETFAKACTRPGVTRRRGDQIGAMLAGAAALHHEREMSVLEAEDFIANNGWVDDEVTQVPEGQDENRLPQTIMENLQTVRDMNGTMCQRSIGELVASLTNTKTYSASRDETEQQLRRIGILVGPRKEDHVVAVSIANNHTELAKILKDTPWASGWGRVLSRISGAVKTKNAIRFGAGVLQRGVSIPIAALGIADEAEADPLTSRSTTGDTVP